MPKRDHLIRARLELGSRNTPADVLIKDEGRGEWGRGDYLSLIRRRLIGDRFLSAESVGRSDLSEVQLVCKKVIVFGSYKEIILYVVIVMSIT